MPQTRKDEKPVLIQSEPILFLVFVRGDRFHQGHQLTLNGLILDLAVSTQQPQAECAVEKQQALDLTGLAVAVVKEGDGHIERGRDLLKTGGYHAVDALLVFLNLLETDAELLAEFRLLNLLLHSPQSDSFSKLNVRLAGTALLHLLCYRFVHTGFTVLRL